MSAASEFTRVEAPSESVHWAVTTRAAIAGFRTSDRVPPPEVVLIAHGSPFSVQDYFTVDQARALASALNAAADAVEAGS